MSESTRLTVVSDSIEAEILVAALHYKAIGSFTKLADVAAGAYGITGGAGPIEVWVSSDDFDRARDLLSRIGDKDGEKPWRCKGSGSLPLPGSTVKHAPRHPEVSFGTCSVCGEPQALDNNGAIHAHNTPLRITRKTHPTT